MQANQPDGKGIIDKNYFSLLQGNYLYQGCTTHNRYLAETIVNSCHF